jgi:hypothetical protein
LAPRPFDAGLDVDEDAFGFYREFPTSYACGEVHKMGRTWAITGISHRKAIPPGAAVHQSVQIRMADSEMNDRPTERRLSRGPERGLSENRSTSPTRLNSGKKEPWGVQG